MIPDTDVRWKCPACDHVNFDDPETVGGGSPCVACATPLHLKCGMGLVGCSLIATVDVPYQSRGQEPITDAMRLR